MTIRANVAVAAALLPLLFASAASASDVAPRPSAGCSLDHITAGRRLTEHIEVGGIRREYILDVPNALRARTPVPLLLDFHGFGHSGAGVWAVSGFRDLAAANGFITVYPEGLPVRLRLRGEEFERPGWEMYTLQGNRDLAFVRAVLDELERRYCIDRARIYATGFSNGGFFSSLLGCTLADRIAAVAPVSGGPLTVACTPSRGVPVLIHHGRRDDLIPIDAARRARDAWLTADRCAADKSEPDGPSCTLWTNCRAGAVVEYCEEDVGHTWPPDASKRVWEFLKAHPLPAQ